MCLSFPVLGAHATPVADYHVIPLPHTVTMTKARPFLLTASTPVVYANESPEMERNANFLLEYVRKNTGLSLTATTRKQKGSVTLQLDKRVKAKEGYAVTVTEKGITVAGSTPQGVFYGIQMLRKSLPVVSGEQTVEMPAAVISDAPRFAYRGMMLDCSRHFFSVDFVKEYLDLMALHNMNVFHWHLTDDQGWRIEIKKYPRLTEIGSMRSGTIMGHNSDVDDGQPYGGFYTQQQARDIVAYARERNITVIPEIDMPGHMMAALAAYPELGCTGGPYQVGHYWGVYADILCAGNEKTFQFVEDVLDEIMAIFPSEYIHIGGDESPRKRWESCPKCQQRVKDEHLQGSKERPAEALLQGYFTNRVEKYLASKGRKMIGWDEILDGDILPSATIMSWRGAEPGAKAAELGHDVVMSPGTHAYFDHCQIEDTKYEPMLIGGYLPVSKVYEFEPVPADASEAARNHIIGAQANLWTEYIAYPHLVEYQVLPRMAALAEVQWMAPEQKNYEQFLQRLPRLVDLYKAYGWTYARHIWPEYNTRPDY